MSTLQVDRIIPYQSSSVLVEGLSAPNLATTGSNTFVGNQNIQGTITASIQEGFALVGGVGNVSTLVATSSFGGALPSGVVSGSAQISSLGFATTGSNTFNGDQTITGVVTISGSSATDLRVIGNQVITGSLTVSSSEATGFAIINRTNTIGQYFGNTFGGNIGIYTLANLEEIGFALDGATWTTNWGNGPLIYVNNTPGDTYEGVFGFQNKANYTDGRVSVLKPMEVTGSVSLSSTLRLAAQNPLPTGGVGQLAVSGSNLYYHNGSTWTQIN